MDPAASSCLQAEEEKRDLQLSNPLACTLTIIFQNCQIQCTNLDLSRPKLGPASIKHKIRHSGRQTCLADPHVGYSAPHGPAPLSRAQRKSRRAGQIGPIRWAITLPFFVPNSPNLR